MHYDFHESQVDPKTKVDEQTRSNITTRVIERYHRTMGHPCGQFDRLSVNGPYRPLGH